MYTLTLDYSFSCLSSKHLSSAHSLMNTVLDTDYIKWKGPLMGGDRKKPFTTRRHRVNQMRCWCHHKIQWCPFKWKQFVCERCTCVCSLNVPMGRGSLSWALRVIMIHLAQGTV